MIVKNLSIGFVAAGIIAVLSCGSPQNTDSTLKPQSSILMTTDPVARISSSVNSSSVAENHAGKQVETSPKSQAEKDSMLVGKWLIYFPTPDDNWGFIFNNDKSFRYFDKSIEAKKKRYWFTDGEWRINDHFIEIQITSYSIRDREAVNGPMGFQFPPETRPIEKKVSDGLWYKIGTLESLRTGLVYDGLLAPLRITLLPLLFDKVQVEPVEYYQFTNE